MGKISGVSGLHNASKLVSGLSNKYVSASMVKTGFLPDSSIRTFDILFAPILNVSATGVSWMQALLPAHTAGFSVNPIGGSTTSQLQFANYVNTVRHIGFSVSSLGVASPPGLGHLSTEVGMSLLGLAGQVIYTNNRE